MACAEQGFVPARRRAIINFADKSEPPAQTYETLNSLERRLPRNFLHCHKSFIVNLEYIVGIDSKTARTVSGLEVNISRSRQNEVREALADYLTLPTSDALVK